MWLLEHLSLIVDSDAKILTASLISLYAYTTALRLLYVVPGRWIGWYNPNHYHLFLLPWRVIMPAVFWLRDWVEEWSFSSGANAKWAGPVERMARLLYKPGMLPIGRLRLFNVPVNQPLGVDLKRHAALIAGTGVGKTTAVMTMLGLHRGSSIIIDPDGQISRSLHSRCGAGAQGVIGKGYPSFVLDHKGLMKGMETAQWNVFDEMDRVKKAYDEAAVVDYAMEIAAAMIMKEKGETKPFFPKSARGLMLGFLMFIWDKYPPGDPKRTLVHLRRLLIDGDTSPRPKEFANLTPTRWLLAQMAGYGPEYGGCVATAAHLIENSSDGAGKDIFTTAVSDTLWLDFPSAHKVVGGKSSFSFWDCKLSRQHVAIVGPLKEIQGGYAPYVRLLIMVSLYTFQLIEGEPKESCLMVCDEMPHLGNIPALDGAPGTVRKTGIRLVAIAQNIKQIQDVYPSTWEDFLGDADVVIWMGTEHSVNLKYISEKLGKRTRAERVEGGRFSKVKRVQSVDRELMTPDQVRKFLNPKRGNSIVQFYGERYARLHNDRYYQSLPVFFYAAAVADRGLRSLGRIVANALISGPASVPVTPKAAPAASKPRPADTRKPQSPPRHQKPSSPPRSKPQGFVGEGMDLEMARSMYGLNGGPFTKADIIAQDELVMASGRGNRDFEVRVYQARALLMQHAGKR